MAETLARDPMQAAQSGEPRRDFLHLTAGAIGALGTGIAVWPLIDSMNPSAEVAALTSIDLDIDPIVVGQRITAKWRGNPVFVSHRTPEEIAAARVDDDADLPDPEPDSARVQRAEWLIVVGVCTHLGCIPLGQKASDRRGQWQGWFCPCHGSHYDTSGRIRKGPAPKNLYLPDYAFVENAVVRIG